jgi:hypothetical protein
MEEQSLAADDRASLTIEAKRMKLAPLGQNAKPAQGGGRGRPGEMRNIVAR